MTGQPMDDAYGPGARPDGAVVVVRCDSGPHRRVGRFLFEHLDGGGWTARRALSQAEADDRGQRVTGGVVSTANGWRLVCPHCGRDRRFDGARLAAVLDALVVAGIDHIGLDTLAEAYARTGS